MKFLKRMKNTMNKSKGFVARNLSILGFIAVYVLTVSIHLSTDSFIADNQLGLLIIFAPFFLMGAALDFIVRNNDELGGFSSAVARLLPLGIILLWLPNASLMKYSSSNSVVQFYFYYIGYLVWLLIALPLFLASFNRDAFRNKTIRSLTGTAAFGIVYLILTTKTGFLDKGAGFVTILISYFFIFYAISGIQSMNYVAPAIGIINAVIMLIFYFFPGSRGNLGWDSNINLKIDIMMLLTFITCIIIRVYATFISRKKALAKN